MIEQYGSGDTGSQVAPASWPVETGPSYINPQESQSVTVPINPLENETMIREWGSKLVDHLVDASRLAARVAALETKLNVVQQDYDRVYSELRQEVAAHSQTKRNLEDNSNAHHAELEYQKGRVEKAENEALAQMQEVDRLKAELANEREARASAERVVNSLRDSEAQAHQRLSDEQVSWRERQEQFEVEIAHLRDHNNRLQDKFKRTVEVWSS